MITVTFDCVTRCPTAAFALRCALFCVDVTFTFALLQLICVAELHVCCDLRYGCVTVPFALLRPVLLIDYALHTFTLTRLRLHAGYVLHFAFSYARWLRATLLLIAHVDSLRYARLVPFDFTPSRSPHV